MNRVSTFIGQLRTFPGYQNSLCFVDQGIVSVISFVGAALVGRICGDEELGIYGTAVTTFWLLAGIPNALVWTPFVAKAPRLTQARRELYKDSSTLQVVLLAVIVASLLFVLERLAYSQGLSPAWLTRVTWGLIPFFMLTTLREHVRRLYLSRIDGEGLLIADVPIALGQIGLLAFLVITSRIDSYNVLIAMSLPCLWALLILVYHHRRSFDFSKIFLHWKYNCQLGFSLLIVTLLALLGDLFLRFVLASFYDITALGRLSAVLVTVTFFNPIQLTVQSLTRARVAMSYAGGDKQSMLIQTRKSMLVTAVYMGVLYLLLSLFGGFIAELLFGRKFSGIDGNVIVLCMAAYLQTLTFPTEAALASLRRGKSILVAAGLKCLVLVLLGLPLIYYFEIIGFGIAMSISVLGVIVYQWIALHKECVHAQ